MASDPSQTAVLDEFFNGILSFRNTLPSIKANQPDWRARLGRGSFPVATPSQLRWASDSQ
jgi:hypothetical protein